MKTFLPSLFCCLIAATLAPHSHAAGCALQPLVPRDRTLTVGTATIDLGDADQPSSPSAWQGPLKAGTCTLEIGIIERPMALTPAQLLYVTSYSGSMRTVTLLDLNTCAARWKSKPFAGKVALSASALTLGQKRIALDTQCLPDTGKMAKKR